MRHRSHPRRRAVETSATGTSAVYNPVFPLERSRASRVNAAAPATAPWRTMLSRLRTQPASWAVTLLGIAVLAFGVRLRFLLQGGGLGALGNYDDGVYFGAAVAFVHQKMPYADFVLLHPPGIVLGLAPFALLGGLTDELTGWMLARLAFMVLGAISAVLVARLLRQVGLFAAVFGGLTYAVFYPAVYVESSTQLQGLSNVLLLLGLTALARADRLERWRWFGIAGALLGLTATVKVWGVMAVVLVIAWYVVRGRFRAALALLVGAGLGTTAVCLPFFLNAPATMWRYLVTAQLGRDRSSDALEVRTDNIVGLKGFDALPDVSVWVVVAAVVFVLACVAACTHPAGRLPVVLFLGLAAFLIASPTWFQHYAALSAPAAALVMGAASGRLIDLLGWAWSPLRWVGGLALLAVLFLYATPPDDAGFGREFPARSMRPLVADVTGCVTSDVAGILIELDVLGQNIERGCPLVVDLGGYSYAIDRDVLPRSRARDAQWQRVALDYLRSGDVTIVAKYREGRGFSKASSDTIKAWPKIDKVGRYTVRTPEPAAR